MPVTSKLLTAAAKVLADNDRQNYTVPAGDLYPHQWLWDSCFIAIGLCHLDIERAKTEIQSLLRGQWRNGMLPNMVFSDKREFAADRNAWRSWLSPYAPEGVATSGITQPPMLAEAIVRIGQKMELPERRTWYRQMWPALLAYHQWIYEDRDPHGEGLALLIHPWETGFDNTPPWMSELQEHQLPLWIRAMRKTHADSIVGLFRRDTRSVPANERFTNVEVLALFDIQLRLRRKGYNIDKVLNHSLFAIEDLGFNAILIRANQHLRDIAKDIKETLPEELSASITHTEEAFENLWHETSGQYYSRDFITHNLIFESSIATLLPLYAGNISKERAARLVKLLESEHSFGLAYPVPSVPKSSQYFDPKRYWQGPTWMNTNWLVIDGLRRYGYNDHADLLTDLSLELVHKSGFSEYFNPLTGEAEGADNFSWTAALVIDLAQQKSKTSR
ncbi:MAG: trehalase family glycosidase [Candidatus Saccharimonadales bacterium]